MCVNGHWRVSMIFSEKEKVGNLLLIFWENYTDSAAGAWWKNMRYQLTWEGSCESYRQQAYPGRQAANTPAVKSLTLPKAASFPQILMAWKKKSSPGSGWVLLALGGFAGGTPAWQSEGRATHVPHKAGFIWIEMSSVPQIMGYYCTPWISIHPQPMWLQLQPSQFELIFQVWLRETMHQMF